MAGSRVHKVGNVFSRVTGLMRAKAIKEEERPLWYDVYKAFPPTHEPSFHRPAPDKEIKDIFYAEDLIRADFYREFPNVVMNLSKKNNLVERFVNKYRELECKDVEDPFEAAVDALNLRTQKSLRPTSKAGVGDDPKKIKSPDAQETLAASSPEERADERRPPSGRDEKDPTPDVTVSQLINFKNAEEK